MIRILSLSEAFDEAIDNGYGREKIAACRSLEDAMKVPMVDLSSEPGELGAFICKMSDAEYYVFRFVEGKFHGSPF